MRSHVGAAARQRRRERSRLRAGGAGAVAGFGAASIGQHLTAGRLLETSLGLTDLPFLLLALALVYGGWWLLGSDLEARRIGRIAGWSALGLLGLVGIGLWLAPVGRGAGPGLTALTADVGTVGAAAGLLVGLQTERRPGPPVATDPRFEHLNRLLRHHLLNGAAVIRGHAELLVEGDGAERQAAAIRRRADDLADVVGHVATLCRASSGELPARSIDPDAALSAAVDRVDRDRPAADIDLELTGPGPVWGHDELDTALAALLRSVIDVADAGTVRVTTTEDGDIVGVRIAYDGPTPAGIEATAGGAHDLGLHLARTLLEAADGEIVAPDEGGVTVRLRRRG